jgi:hypothetical protein
MFVLGRCDGSNGKFEPGWFSFTRVPLLAADATPKSLDLSFAGAMWSANRQHDAGIANDDLSCHWPLPHAIHAKRFRPVERLVATRRRAVSRAVRPDAAATDLTHWTF